MALARTLAYAAVALAAACAAEARPPMGDSPAAGAEISTAPPPPLSAAQERKQVCVPASVRACQLEWQDDRGQRHCLTAKEYCKRSGFGWTACGDFEEAFREVWSDGGS